MADIDSADPMISTEPEIELDAETSAEVDVGVRAADEDRVTPSEEVPQLIREWISQIVFTEPALADLEEILARSWSHYPIETEELAGALLIHIGLLREFHLIGVPVAGRPRQRRLLHTPFHVYYRVRLQWRRIEILRIWHTSRRTPKT